MSKVYENIFDITNPSLKDKLKITSKVGEEWLATLIGIGDHDLLFMLDDAVRCCEFNEIQKELEVINNYFPCYKFRIPEDYEVMFLLARESDRVAYNVYGKSVQWWMKSNDSEMDKFVDSSGSINCIPKTRPRALTGIGLCYMRRLCYIRPVFTVTIDNNPCPLGVREDPKNEAEIKKHLNPSRIPVEEEDEQRMPLLTTTEAAIIKDFMETYIGNELNSLTEIYPPSEIFYNLNILSSAYDKISAYC